MLLRASSELQGESADLHAVTDGEAAAHSGVVDGEILVRFAEACVQGTDEELDRARADALAKLQPDAFVDAAAVVGNFQRMVRIADGAGIPLDTPLQVLASNVVTEIGIDQFSSAQNTRPLGALGRLAGRVLSPVAMPLARLFARRMMRGAPPS